MLFSQSTMISKTTLTIGDCDAPLVSLRREKYLVALQPDTFRFGETLRN